MASNQMHEACLTCMATSGSGARTITGQNIPQRAAPIPAALAVAKAGCFEAVRGVIMPETAWRGISHAAAASDRTANYGFRIVLQAASCLMP